jgi:hypothetical protein
MQLIQGDEFLFQRKYLPGEIRHQQASKHQKQHGDENEPSPDDISPNETFHDFSSVCPVIASRFNLK